MIAGDTKRTGAFRALPSLTRYQSLLALLLFVTFLMNLSWSLITPPLMAVDEPQHFLYGQAIERQKQLCPETTTAIPLELCQLADLVQAVPVRFHDRPILLDWNKPAADPDSIEHGLAQLNDASLKSQTREDAKQLIATQRSFNAYHPPLYYLILAALQRALEQQSISLRFFACRLLSVVSGIVTVWLAYRGGLHIFAGDRGRALILAALVSYQPQLTFTMSSITNGAFETVIFSAFIVLSSAAIRQGLDARKLFGLAAVTLAGLLTKASLLSLLPLLLLLACLCSLQKPKAERVRALAAALAVTAVVAAAAAPWYLRSITCGGSGFTHFFPSTAQEAHVFGPRPFFHMPAIDYCAHAYATYWAKFGWVDTAMPLWSYFVIVALTGAAIALSAQFLWRQWRSARDRLSAENLGLILFLSLAGMAPVLFYALLNVYFLLARHCDFPVRGQYFLPAIVCHMAWFVAVASYIAPQAVRSWLPRLLVALMIVFNLSAYFLVTAPRFFGRAPILELLRRASMIEPVGQSWLIAIALSYALGSLAVLLFVLLYLGTPATRVELEPGSETEPLQLP